MCPDLFEETDPRDFRAPSGLPPHACPGKSHRRFVCINSKQRNGANHSPPLFQLRPHSEKPIIVILLPFPADPRREFDPHSRSGTTVSAHLEPLRHLPVPIFHVHWERKHGEIDLHSDLIRWGRGNSMYDQILVVTDRSDGIYKAITEAVGLADYTGATL